jgi:hypothetical protein
VSQIWTHLLPIGYSTDMGGTRNSRTHQSIDSGSSTLLVRQAIDLMTASLDPLVHRQAHSRIGSISSFPRVCCSTPAASRTRSLFPWPPHTTGVANRMDLQQAPMCCHIFVSPMQPYRSKVQTSKMVPP